MQLKYLLSLIFLIFVCPNFAFASAIESDIAAFNLITNYKLLFLGGVFVILMQAGFAVVEGGYENTQKSVYALIVNYISAILGTLFFSLVSSKIFHADVVDSVNYLSAMLRGWHWNLLFFYMLMATTITTVVGRVIPNRTSLWVNWIVGFMIAGVIFPFFSSWVWGNIAFGGGWLKALGFIDFAGSTVVHSTAAWIVLAGYFTSKSNDKQEISKKDLIFEDYKILSLALAGFILWLAWSGLNIVYISTYRIDIGLIVVNAFAALFGAMLASWALSLLMNNKIISWAELIKAALGGLVAITASCGLVGFSSALIIGLVSGALTNYLPHLLTRWIASKHIREVVVVHGICGIWGTLAVSLNNNPNIQLTHRASVLDQIMGIGVNFIWSFGVAFLVFKLICSINSRFKAQI
ncbi:ammonium transporter [Acinetobacter bereziniae]|uniref:ammonium transporter n=1 Tax=Acinetobacter bereziniae TaxID=106648 RepID=UPI001ABD182F|nr:ammonium transporter [Acinetobacter bereziniae]